MGLKGTATEDIGPARRGPTLVDYDIRTEVDRAPYFRRTSGPERGSYYCQ